MGDKNWFVHVELLVVLVTLLGEFYLLDGKIERQGERTDKLYEIWVETHKEIKDIQIRMNQEILEMKKEHYEFMKERK